MEQTEQRKQSAIAVAAVVVILGLGVAWYPHRIARWLAYDDEGGYLYAAWRISIGEVPYRDFLTPQLPAFLYPGALVLRLSNFSVLAARLWMMALALGASLFLYQTVRLLWGDWLAALALALVLVQGEFFWAARFFRPEASMLFWAALGILLFVWGYPRRHRVLLALSGASLGLATMSKLFGALSMVGVGLFLLCETSHNRQWRDMLVTGLLVGTPFLAVVAGLSGLFIWLTPNFLAAVLGHHLRQGSGTPLPQVVAKGLKLYWEFLRLQPAYSLLAIIGLIVIWRCPKRLTRLFGCQLATGLAFLFIGRELQGRHLAYLVPSLAALGAAGLGGAWGLLSADGSAWWRRVVAGVVVVAGVALALWPHWTRNAWVASWEEHDTETWAAYLQANTAPDGVVMSDYPGINFYGRRRTTPIAAGISRGAAQSGQIMGADLIREIEENDVQMVLLNVAQGAHQFVRLRDYPQFKQYVQTHFFLAERRKYDHRLMEIYARGDLWPGKKVEANFGHQLELSGCRWLENQAAPGEDLQISLRWQGLAAMPRDYHVTLRLLDNEGHEWGLGSKRLVDVDKDTYWDERGLERPVLIPTSRWPPGEATVEVFELPVELATPPGAYDIVLRVHPEDAWNGLPLLDERGAPTGYDLDIGKASVIRASAPPDLAELPIEYRAEVDLAPEIRLVGYSLPPVESHPGDELQISVFWETISQPTRDYQLRLELQSGRETWAQLLTSLSRPGYPTSRWRQGEILRGQHGFFLEPETPAGEYSLVAALLDEGRVVGQVALGSIRVAGRPHLFKVPDLSQRVGALLGDVVTLLGYDLQGKVGPGDMLSLTLYWRAEEKMSIPYTVFTHLVDEKGRIWGQQDNAPVRGTCPTTGWLPGEIVIDEYAIPVQTDAPAGMYRLEVGLYEAMTGVRLPGVDAAGEELEGDRILLRSVRIEAPQ